MKTSLDSSLSLLPPIAWRRLLGATWLSLLLPSFALAAASADSTPAGPRTDYYILTPKPGPQPRINGARVFGVRPGSPLLFTVAATGETPLAYSAEGLPAGLTIDPANGRITGTIASREAKTYRVNLRVRNPRGEAARELRIIVGDRIALTPPLGWNSWNSWAAAVDEAKVRATAAAMARLLKGHGWTYVNIDDTWQGQRGGPFNAIQPNEKFGDMKKLADAVHALGLKLGTYSTPWVTSYGGHIGGSADQPDGAWAKPVDKKGGRTGHLIGKHTFEAADARQWAEWGIDYVKYDWKPNDLPATTRLADALRAQSRDIVYSLSNTAPFQNAADYARLANAWRTGGDIRDVWDNGTSVPEKFKGIYDTWLLEERWNPFVGPGHWPDPDMLVVGKVGWGPKLHPSNLTADEQYTHISLWCLWSAPLLIGCPIEDMDEFTLNLLTNDEVLAIDQDPLGQPATTVLSDGDRQVMVKPLEDGALAVGLFNRGSAPLKVAAPWATLVRDGPQKVRDLWRQQDLGTFPAEFSAMVPAHGVVLVRVAPAK